MISLKLLFYLAIGTAAMLVPIMIQGKWNDIKPLKRVAIAFLLTICGTVGTYILFFIENGWIGGTSFFGAIFFVPILFLPLAKLLKIPFGILLDICSPAECIMLAIMKVQCQISGCCGGREVCFMGEEFIFPSQIAEMINALMIFVILMLLAYRKNNIGKIYPLLMVIYGISRFILNIFREVWITTDMILPFGNIWSLLAVMVGIIWLIIIKKQNCRKEQNE